MSTTARLLTLTVACFILPFMGCALDVDDQEEDPESEGFGETHDELRTGVSCKERTDTAYESGSPKKIQVITVGGKPVAKPAGHAFLKLQAAAQSAGVSISISSGFRTMAEQQYFYDCYKSGKCNGGNLAARPGFGKHQNGTALDLTPSSSTWLQSNYKRFGFARTVPSEAWHFQFSGSDPGGPCSRGADAPDDSEAENGDASSAPVAGGIAWVTPKQDDTQTNGFTVRAHAKTPSIVKVVYSQGSFVFGTSTNGANDFALAYRFKYTGDKTLTVKGYDGKGGLVAEDNVDFTLAP
jgi:hypothetical protein